MKVGNGFEIWNSGWKAADSQTLRLMERISKELKRRTREATLFPNEASLLRLVSAVLMEISEEWETEKTKIGMTNLHSPEQVCLNLQKKCCFYSTSGVNCVHIELN